MSALNDYYISREVRRLRVAVGYFTRVPMGTISGFSDGDLDHASRYLPWIGLGIGAIVAGVFGLSALWLPQAAAAILAIVAGLLLTGCFHEDGLADVCDGFGGGFTVADKLRIMKDSRIGTYGASALWVVLSLRTAILAVVEPTLGAVLLVVGHALSRIAPIALIYFLEYVRDTAQARAKPVAQGMTLSGFLIGLAVIVPLGIWQPHLIVVTGIILAGAILLMARLCIRQIGGYTGDFLGFSQQIAEVLIYLAASGLWLST
ncbi:MAG: adenosylcobinamide-GDP ribazoletransferase [Arenicellales bacterium]